MKWTWLLFLVMLVLIGIYFVTDQKEEKKTSIKIEDREFVLTEPDLVEVITIDSKGRPAIHLGKTKDGWYINNRHRANQRIVQNMLNTLTKMSIKYIPTKAENQTALKRMGMHGIEIKTYDKAGKVITDFTLGTNTNDEYGTYCLKRDASQTYVMSVPVVEGGIRNFFTQTQEEMRDLNVFAFSTNEIRSIQVDYPKDLKSSFAIHREGVNYKFISEIKNTEASQNIMDAYVKDFNSLTSEYVKNDHVLKDTILTFMPFMKVKVEVQHKPDFSFQVFSQLDLANSNVNTRSPGDITKLHEKFFVHTNADDFYMVQNIFFNKFIKKPSYFYEKSK